jgi:hypothetical protein
MGIIAKAGAEFTPAPAGTHAAVCVDIIDIGMVLSEFKGVKKNQHKIKIVWQIDEDQANGKPFTVSQRYTLSLHQKATLRRDLESWRGKPFSEEELKAFDLENLLGAGALLNVIHNHREGSTYANVASVMRLMKGMATPAPRDYVRVCDRPRDGAMVSGPGAGSHEWGGEMEYDDPGAYPGNEDVPF